MIIRRLMLLVLVLLSVPSAYAAVDCAPGAPVVAFFIDVTTAMPEREVANLFSGLRKTVEEMDAGARLRVATIDESFTTSKVVFDACVPGCAEGTNGALGTCNALREKRVKFPPFIAGLTAAANDAVVSAGRDGSSILMSLDYLTRPLDSSPTKVIVFSDMLERSEVLDLLEETKDGKAIPLESLPALARAGFQLRLVGSDVVVFGFGVEDSAHEPLPTSMLGNIEGFWRAIFDRAGARSVKFLADLK